MFAEIEAGRPEVAAAMAAPVRASLGVLASSAPDSPRRLDDLKAVARARLASASLRAEDVGQAFGVSARTVQAEFASAGETFAGWLLGERLDLAHTRLTASAWRSRSIAEIAAACGFRDPTHFHRVLRGRFDTTPGDLRPRR